MQADGVADYYAAETLLIQETFQRQLGCQVSLLSALRVRCVQPLHDVQGKRIAERRGYG